MGRVHVPPRAPARAAMEREASYLTVGAFVLLVIALGTWFVIWYTDRQDQRDYKRFEIYFEGSVAGLSKGGPVRYLGVDVGRVVRMNIDPRASDRVQVIVDIDAQAPISDETRDAQPAGCHRTPLYRSGARPRRQTGHAACSESKLSGDSHRQVELRHPAQ